MKKNRLMPVILILVFFACVLSVYMVNLSGSSTPKAHAAPNEIYDLCKLLNTDLTTMEVDWAGFLQCVYDYEEAT